VILMWTEEKEANLVWDEQARDAFRKLVEQSRFGIGLDQQGLQIKPNPNKYDIDTEVWFQGTLCAYFELAAKPNWKCEPFSYKTLLIPGRKEKFAIGLELPRVHVTFNSIFSDCLFVDYAEVLKSKRSVMSGEEIFLVPVEKCGRGCEALVDRVYDVSSSYLGSKMFKPRG
jgi:hypothetical protein